MSAEGRLIAGRYRLQKRIGSGAMGVVWRAVDERLQRTVAVKQLLLQPGHTEAETQEARERSMREGRIAARLQHQNAIAVFDVAEEDGGPVLVMEYLPSESLSSVIAERGVLPPLEVAGIGAQVAGALAAAHLAGIVHRDLKPGNILLGEDGTAKITDFGISRAIGDVAVTKSGILAGTPAYLSPEVALGRDPAAPSDVFSLGSTLYAAIEGHPPFGTDDNAISLLHRVSRGQVEQPRNAGPLTGALMQLLRADPADRPTMAQARELLQAARDGRTVSGSGPVRSQQPPAHAPPPPRGGHPAGPRPAPQPAPNAARAEGTRTDNPPTRVGAAAPATALSANNGSPLMSTKTRGRLLWAAALLVAILLGVVVATIARGGEQGSAAPSTTEAPATTKPTSASADKVTRQPAGTPGTTPRTSSAKRVTTSTTTRTSRKDEVSKAELESTVADYFRLVPDDTDKSWKMLGPELRAKASGKDNYEEFWDSIEKVEIVDGPQAVGGDKVRATLRYTSDDGDKSTESKVFGMVVKNGEPLINTESAS